MQWSLRGIEVEDAIHHGVGAEVARRGVFRLRHEAWGGGASGLFDVVFFHFAVQGAAGDIQGGGRLLEVPPLCFENLPDQCLFGAGEGT